MQYESLAAPDGPKTLHPTKGFGQRATQKPLRRTNRKGGRWVLLLPLLAGLLTVSPFVLGFAADADVVLAIEGPAEPYIATLSGGTPHFVGFRESIRGEGVRFKNVPPGSHLLRLETRCGAVLERVVNVDATSANTPLRVKIRLGDAVFPADWKGGKHTSSVRDLSWPAATHKALLEGWKHMERGEVNAARACLRKAITLSPDCADAWTNLGLMAEWDDSFEEAERFHREAFRLDPDSFARNLNLSEVLERVGKLDEAIAYGERAHQLRPRDLGVNLHLGAVFGKIYRFDRVIPLLSTAKSIHPDSLGMTQILLGIAYAETGSRDKAVAEMNEWLQRFPDHPSYDLVRASVEELKAMPKTVAVR